MQKIIFIFLLGIAAYGLTVYDVQYSPTGPSPYEDSVVTVSAIVTATGHNGDKYFIGDPSGGPWTGVYIYDFTYTVTQGEWVTLTGTVDEYYGYTEIKELTSLTVDSTTAVPPSYSTTCAIAGSSEALEGVLITLSNLVVVQDSSDVCWVDDGSGIIKMLNGFDYAYDAEVGDSITSLTGLLIYDWGEFCIEPRSDGDIDVIADTTTPDTSGYHSIRELQENSSAFMGETVRIEAVVTIGAGLISDSQLKAYVQDSSGYGIQLFTYTPSAADSEIVKGNLLSIIGEVDEYNGNLEIVDASWEILATDQSIPVPIDAFSVADPGDNDGTWMSVGGHVSSINDYGNATNIYVSRGSDERLIRVWSSTGVDLSGISSGDSVVIEGVSSVFSSAFQLLPAYQEDITVVADTSAPPDTGLTPIADIQNNVSTYEGQDVTVLGVITAGAGNLRDDMLSAYIQDGSGMGIQLFDYDLTAHMESLMVRGALIQVTGEVAEYSGETEIIIDSWESVGSDTLPTPLDVLDVWENSTDYEGTWMMADGIIVDAYSTGDDWNAVIDLTGSLSYLVTMRIWSTTGIDGDSLDVGQHVTAYGIGGTYYSDFQLVPAAPEDIIIWRDEPTGEISLQIEEGVLAPSNGEKLTIQLSVPLGNRAILRLFDRMGRTVTTLFDGSPVATVNIEWDGRDEIGQLVRNGVYLLYLESIGASGDRETRKATIAVGSVLK